MTRHHSRKGARGQDRHARGGGQSRYDGTMRKRVWDESPSLHGEKDRRRRSLEFRKKMIEGTVRVWRDQSRNLGHWRMKPRRGLIDHKRMLSTDTTKRVSGLGQVVGSRFGIGLPTSHPEIPTAVPRAGMRPREKEDGGGSTTRRVMTSLREEQGSEGTKTGPMGHLTLG